MGTFTVGACPAVPAGETSAAGMGPMAVSALLPGAAVVVVVALEPLPVSPDVPAVLEDVADGVDGELQAARTSVPAAASATMARARRRGRGSDMGRDGSRWLRGSTGSRRSGWRH